jgi:hypothetical protein
MHSTSSTEFLLTIARSVIPIRFQRDILSV